MGRVDRPHRHEPASPAARANTRDDERGRLAGRLLVGADMRSLLALVLAAASWAALPAYAGPPAAQASVAALGQVRLREPNGTRRFDLVKKLGNGAWSDAYEAREQGSNRRVAVKMLKPDVVAKGKKDTYDKELRVVSQSHAASASIKKSTSLMNLYGIGQSGDGRRALVMEYAEGRKIEPRVRPTHEAAQIGMRILRGVRAMHLAGYRHNDLHLGNIAMDPNKGPASLRILDVGNAIPLDNPSGANQGGFAPPERNVAGLGARGDVYTVGALLYYASTGTKLDREHPDLGRVREPALRQIIAKAVDADPRKRYADAQSFLNALRPLGQPPRVAN